uniref:ATP synthase complex subunit 8 n=2 Tax=Phaedon TaxID=80248 RepID=A0A3G1GSS4_9CUCU|nr:ATP synthase F0 subunit 8 [Phaedon armoraciae]APX40827.1 ATP synthase F0 subunit 8 [Phaedon tumidulus]
MPQMMPLNWLILMFFFIMIFLLFNIMNYFMFSYKIKSFKNFSKNITYNWKW